MTVTHKLKRLAPVLCCALVGLRAVFHSNSDPTHLTRGVHAGHSAKQLPYLGPSRLVEADI